MDTWDMAIHHQEDELGQELPHGLAMIAKDNIHFLTHDPLSIGDKIKRLFEAYSGEEWDWWPLRPPRKPLGWQQVRLQWTCVSISIQVRRYHTDQYQQCGQLRSVDISQGLASEIQVFLDHQKSSAPTPPARVAAGPSTSTGRGGRRLASSQRHPTASGRSSNTQPSGLQQSADTHSRASACTERHGDSAVNPEPVTKDFYVLLCVVRGDRLHHTQIEVARSWDDDTFFAKFRAEYKRLRGFWRYWFHPRQFAFCHFARFTRYYVDRLAKVRYELPLESCYEYQPRPPDVPYVPPIPEHEWYDRYHSAELNTCGRQEALSKIPKRKHRFQTSLHVSGREDMWGLLVEFRISLLRVLFWQVLLTLGGFGFWGWWLKKHPGDLQAASVPVTVIIACMMMLWAPLNEKFRNPM